MPQRRVREIPSLTPQQAAYVLEALVKERKIAPRDIRRALDRMRDEITELEARLSALREIGSSKKASRVGSSKKASRASTKRARSRSRMPTAEATASRQLQGRYMSLIQQIPKSRRGKFKKLAKEKGREAAVKAMKTALK